MHIICSPVGPQGGVEVPRAVPTFWAVDSGESTAVLQELGLVMSHSPINEHRPSGLPYRSQPFLFLFLGRMFKTLLMVGLLPQLPVVWS